jgi:hypothetical protein
MNGPALLFKQAVRSAHRAVVVIKVHFERLQAVRNWIECWVCRDRYFLRTENDRNCGYECKP